MALPSPAYTRSIALSSAAVKAKLAALDDDEIQVAIDEAAEVYTQLPTWPKYTKVVALHALHILAVSGALGGGLVGQVTSASAGGISQSVGLQAVAVEGGLDLSTRWGQRAMALLRGKAPNLRVARAGTGYSPFL